MVATPESTNKSYWYYLEEMTHVEWFPDSGATNHITSDPTNLMTKAEFFGSDQVHIGNGKGLSIKHIGHSKFTSPFLSPKTLSLKQLLHVPEICKNFLSVSKFAQDKLVYFEFHLTTCFVKDLKTKVALLERHLKDGLYVFNNSQNQSQEKLLTVFCQQLQ